MREAGSHARLKADWVTQPCVLTASTLALPAPGLFVALVSPLALMIDIFRPLRKLSSRGLAVALTGVAELR